MRQFDETSFLRDHYRQQHRRSRLTSARRTTAEAAWTINFADFGPDAKKAEALLRTYAGNTPKSVIRTFGRLSEHYRRYRQLPIATVGGVKGPRGGDSQHQWRCMLCLKVFNTFQKAAVHLTSREWRLANWHCREISCDRVYHSSNELNRHWKTAHNHTVPDDENAHDRASTRFTPPPFSSSSINISSCSQTTRRTGSSMKEPVEVSPISRRPTSAFTVTALPPPQPQPPSVHGHEASEVPISLLPGCPCPGCWPSSYTNAVSLSLLNSSSNVEAPVVHNRTEPSTGITAFTYPSEPEWTPPGTCEMNKAVRDPLDAIETAGVPSSHSISDQEYHNEIVYTPCGPSTFSPSSFVDSQCTPQQWFPPSPLTPSPDPSYPVIFPPGMPATDSTYSQEALQGQWTPSLHWNTDATVSRIRPNDTDSYNAFYVQWPDYNPGIEPFPLRPLNGVPFSIPSDINPSSGWLLPNDRRNDQVLVGPYKDKTDGA